MKEYINKLESTGDYKVIKRFIPTNSYNKKSAEAYNLKTGIFLDTETTGLVPDSDKIIEIAMVPFTFDSDGNIYKVLPEYQSLQDPGISIPEHIIKLTGITDDMVKDKLIDLNQISTILSTVNIVIAHNAKFDRPFVESMFENFKNVNWGCSISDVNWFDEGIESTNLSYLAFKYGFFYGSHRATIDCQVGIEILSRNLPVSHIPVLKKILDNVNRVDIRLYAESSPFEMKDKLKSRGYFWSTGEKGKRKCWYIDLAEDKIDDELCYLSEHIYGKKVESLPMDKIDAKLRYSRRI
jgi:DNA polymerase III subunit epsilon